jgi:hypothetical protein
MCRSSPLFQVTGPWLRLRLNHTAADFDIDWTTLGGVGPGYRALPGQAPEKIPPAPLCLARRTHCGGAKCPIEAGGSLNRNRFLAPRAGIWSRDFAGLVVALITSRAWVGAPFHRGGWLWTRLSRTFIPSTIA